ncbi:hypothetical protein ACLKA7_001090 [Drosophila subpalustris]
MKKCHYREAATSMPVPGNLRIGLVEDKQKKKEAETDEDEDDMLLLASLESHGHHDIYKMGSETSLSLPDNMTRPKASKFLQHTPATSQSTATDSMRRI